MKDEDERPLDIEHRQEEELKRGKKNETVSPDVV